MVAFRLWQPDAVSSDRQRHAEPRGRLMKGPPSRSGSRWPVSTAASSRGFSERSFCGATPREGAPRRPQARRAGRGRRGERPSDNGREYCGLPDKHPYELFLQLEDIEHRTTRVGRASVERLHRAVPPYPPRKSISASRDGRPGMRPSRRIPRKRTRKSSARKEVKEGFPALSCPMCDCGRNYLCPICNLLIQNAVVAHGRPWRLSCLTPPSPDTLIFVNAKGEPRLEVAVHPSPANRRDLRDILPVSLTRARHPWWVLEEA